MKKLLLLTLLFAAVPSFAQTSFQVALQSQVNIGRLPWVNVRDAPHLAKCDGTNDDKEEIQSAINVVGPHAVLIDGNCRITSGLLVNQARVHLIGISKQGAISRITFDPPSASPGQAAVEFNCAGAVCYQNSIQDISFASNDSTTRKVAIRAVDTSELLISDIAIGPGPVVNTWTGDGSIGIELRGRELGTVQRISFSGERPLVIADNPNSTIDLDQWHFEDIYLIGQKTAAVWPIVDIASGVNHTRNVFDGYLEMVGGTDGLRWVDTTSTQVLDGFAISSYSWEQAGAAGGYAIRLEANSGLRAVRIAGSSGGPANGIRLRRVDNVQLAGTAYTGTGECLNIDGTINNVFTVGLYCKGGSTKVTTGAVELAGFGVGADSTQPGRYQEVWVSSTNVNINNGVFLRRPMIADFASALHTHLNEQGGGALSGAALTTGTVADARLSTNVAFRNVDNVFSAAQTFLVPQDANSVIAASNTTNGTAANAIYRTNADVASLSHTSHATARTISRHGVTLGGWNELLSSTGPAGGLAIGTLSTNDVVFGTNQIGRIEIDGSTGNVGVGITAPARRLHVSDTMRLQPRETAPTSAAVGDLYVDSTPAADELCFFDGAAWQGISSGTDANCS